MPISTSDFAPGPLSSGTIRQAENACSPPLDSTHSTADVAPGQQFSLYGRRSMLLVVEPILPWLFPDKLPPPPAQRAAACMTRSSLPRSPLIEECATLTFARALRDAEPGDSQSHDISRNAFGRRLRQKPAGLTSLRPGVAYLVGRLLVVAHGDSCAPDCQR